MSIIVNWPILNTPYNIMMLLNSTRKLIQILWDNAKKTAKKKKKQRRSANNDENYLQSNHEYPFSIFFLRRLVL